MKARMLYKEECGFIHGDGYTSGDGRVAPDQRFENEYRKVKSIDHPYEFAPVFELWEVKESFCVHPYRFYSLICKYDLYFELYFPDWPDLLHFMKEYLPTLKGRD